MDEGYPQQSVRVHFPLSAVKGMGHLSDAIQCLLLSSDVHTLLIRGPSGTGKSVAARSITGIAPDREIIEIPQNITREQLFGSIDIENAIRTGKRSVTESILGRADGNILIADNINLLPEDLLQSLMNAVSDGIIKAEMGGISVDSACDTILIGTMDPDEGELSEHILDRFDMCIFTQSIEDEDTRKEIIRSNLRYESDQTSFVRDHAGDEEAVRERISKARLPDVAVSDDYLGFITKICSEMCIQGHRGDIAVLNVACALSALSGKRNAGLDELKHASHLCLQHRRREPPEPEEEPPEPEEQPPEPDEDDDRNEEVKPDDANQQQPDEGQQSEGNDDDDDGDNDDDGGSQSEKVFAVGEEFDVRDYVPPESRSNRNRKSGKRDLSKSVDSSGRTVGDRIPIGKVTDVALSASIRAAAPYQINRDHDGLAVVLKKEDLREKVRMRMKGTRLLFVVDGSGSVGAHDRMVAVKGAVLSMLNDAYKRRDEVGMVVFRGDGAETVLPMTRSVLTAFRCLQEMPTGGRTPLLSGLMKGYEILKREADMGYEPVMVVLTDGRGNVGIESKKPTAEDNERVSELLSDSGIRIIVIDTEIGLVRFGKAATLSSAIGAEYMRLEELNAERLSETIRSAMKIFE